MQSLTKTLIVVALVAALCLTGAHADRDDEDSEESASLSSLSIGQPSTGRCPPKLWTALQQYVSEFDPYYSWTYMPQYNLVGKGYTAHMINMTSQKWLDSSKVNMPIWYHTMYVVIPANVNFTANAISWIANGYNNPNPTSNLFKISETNLVVAANMALQLKTVVTVTYQVPNQYLIFAEDPTHKARREDEGIAFGWKHFMDNPTDSPQWLMRLPMTKAVIRSMDTTEAFLAQNFNQIVKKWIVSGPSKRGWTTYTVAAVAPTRVIGFAPLVLDQADFKTVVQHQYKCYAGWSYATVDYITNNIFQRTETSAFKQLTDIESPMSYNSILKDIPSLTLSVSGDEFGTPDDINLYWDEWTSGSADKHFRLMPNLDHSMSADIYGVLETIVSWMLLVQSEAERPTYEWKISGDGTLTLKASRDWAPTVVKLWQANTIDGNVRRDFRLSAYNATSNSVVPHPVLFTSTVVTPEKSGNKKIVTYKARVTPPAKGWVGFYFEINWASQWGTTFKTSSAISILPKTFPSKMCSGAQCNGPMV